jgi:hypothetical protein
MKKTAICIAILSIFIFACQKDEAQLVFNPTKASLNLPQFVKDYLGEPAEVADNTLTTEGIETILRTDAFQRRFYGVCFLSQARKRFYRPQSF